MPKKLIAANWKENPKSEKQATELFGAVARANSLKKVEVVICPPFIYLEKLAVTQKKNKKTIALGAQDVFWEEKGAFTSEVGPKMLKSLGVSYVIIGHSERRKWLKETDTMINEKIMLTMADGLMVILCVGEPLAVRKKGVVAAQKFVAAQLRKGLAGMVSAKRNLRNLVIAYEPVWAIGTGRYDKPEDAVAMATFIKSRLKSASHINPRVLYGGSVNGKNIADYVQYKDIDGALVGGASLKANEFKKIINVVSKI